jgi:hypothetical protein
MTSSRFGRSTAGDQKGDGVEKDMSKLQLKRPIQPPLIYCLECKRGIVVPVGSKQVFCSAICKRLYLNKHRVMGKDVDYSDRRMRREEMEKASKNVINLIV